MLNDFRARQCAQKPLKSSEAQKKDPVVSRSTCQPPELSKLDISQHTRNLVNEQSVQSAPATVPASHLHPFRFVFCLIGRLPERRQVGIQYARDLASKILKVYIKSTHVWIAASKGTLSNEV